MQLAEPKEATQEMLLDVHTQEYLDRLNSSSAAIASVRTAGLKPDLPELPDTNARISCFMQICELGALAVLPNSVVQNNLNRPMRHHIAGTMLVCQMPFIMTLTLL